MKSTERVERLMQRAADGELSTEQRHELMEAVEQQQDGWKQLACTFLEEQLVGQTIRQAPPATVSVVQPVRRPTGFWYHHPALSSAVTICFAFVLGLAVPWNQGPNSTPQQTVRTNTESVLAAPVSTGASSGSAARDIELQRKVATILRMLGESERSFSGE